MKCVNCGSDVVLHAPKCAQCEVGIRWQGDEPEFLHAATFVPVFTARDAAELSVIESLLTANGIQFVVSNEDTQDVIGLGRLGGYNLALGPPVVRVPESEADAARELIAEGAASPLASGEDAPITT